MKLGRQTMDKIHSGAAIRPRLVAQVGVGHRGQGRDEGKVGLEGKGVKQGKDGRNGGRRGDREGTRRRVVREGKE